jgi:transcriptional regulator with XRE-family HTH domain
MSSSEEWLTRPGGIAYRLRSLRQGADLSGAALAAKLGWIQPRISKIETGKQMPTAEDVAAWARACGADDATVDELLGVRVDAEVQHKRWQQQVRGGQAAIQQDYDGMVRAATVIRNAEVTTVPGLLQTPDYARYQAHQAVRLHDADPAEIEATVAARIRRQDVLYDTTKQFEFVITEAALRLVLCPRDAMQAQLDRLLGLTFGRANVWFGIIPFGVELLTVPQNRFLMLDETVLVEDFADEVTYRGERAATYAKAMDLLKAEAVEGESARALILKAIAALPDA